MPIAMFVQGSNASSTVRCIVRKCELFNCTIPMSMLPPSAMRRRAYAIASAGVASRGVSWSLSFTAHQRPPDSTEMMARAVRGATCGAHR